MRVTSVNWSLTTLSSGLLLPWTTTSGKKIAERKQSSNFKRLMHNGLNTLYNHNSQHLTSIGSESCARNDGWSYEMLLSCS